MSTLHGEGSVGPADERPLDQQEYQLLQRLLSDPFSLPLQFKTWLVAYLETSDLTLPMGAVMGLRSTLGIAGAGDGTLGIFPAGLVFPYGGDTAPTGALLCDGAAYSRTGEARLFAAIGTRFGAPSGTQFNVPDLRGRVPVGVGPNVAVDTVGKSDSQTPTDRRPQHRHTVNDPGHTHVAARSGQPSGAGAGAGNNVQDATTDPSGTGIWVGAGTSDYMDAPPYVVLNFIIVR